VSAKHTPGPWKVYSIVIGGEPAHRVDGPHKGKPINWRPTLANAHLIAAAPDMLEALEDALCVIQDDGPVRRAITAAIKKARGEK
jgi:hypothetical protein